MGSNAAKHIRGEIGEVLNGSVPGRTDEFEVTVYKSLGIAAQDLAAAHAIYQRATQLGLGVARRVVIAGRLRGFFDGDRQLMHVGDHSELVLLDQPAPVQLVQLVVRVEAIQINNRGRGADRGHRQPHVVDRAELGIGDQQQSDPLPRVVAARGCRRRKPAASARRRRFQRNRYPLSRASGAR